MEKINTKWLIEKPIAHRGLFNKEKPENSLAAFKNAVDNNYGIELDIQFTKDKKIVVFHDDNLERMTKDKRDVSEVTYNELLNLKLLDSEEKIPLLEEVLDIVNGKVPILVEIKNCMNIIELGEKSYNILKNYKGKYTIQSFNPLVVEWYKKNAKEVIRGQLSETYENHKDTMNFVERFVLRNLLLNFKSKPHYICYEIGGLPSFRVSNLRKRGILVIVWTVKNISDMNKASKYSDNIIFDSFIPNK